MNFFLHQTNYQLGNLDQTFKHLHEVIKEQKPGVHLFPEMFLTGYPLNDYIFDPGFIQQYHLHLNDLNHLLQQINLSEDFLLLCGGITYDLNQHKYPEKIFNSIYSITAESKTISPVYHKQLLPNYDIFDEKKYFHSGKESFSFKFQQKNFGLLICEDMWASTTHEENPVLALAKKCEKEEISLDAVINLSASPFHVGKKEKREKRAEEISQLFDCPFIYVNKIGAEDEILFDGQSFIFESGQPIQRGRLFQPDLLHYKLTENGQVRSNNLQEKIKKEEITPNTYQSLFDPKIDLQSRQLNIFSDDEMREVIEGISLGVGEYARKIGATKYIVGLSGGIDSALVAALLYYLLKKNDQNISECLELIYMPSKFSSSLSYDLCQEMAQRMGLKLKLFPIKFLHATFANQFKDHLGTDLAGITDENIQSRIRGAILMARSNQTGALVINTSNKSELSVGYSTQYGDSIGAISPIGDLYKSQIFSLCTYFNKNISNIIPEGIITRPPSAELRENQRDDQSLPPYEDLDCILEGLLSYRFSDNDLQEVLGFSASDVFKVKFLIHKAEFKRKQFCPIVKVQTKSFGFGHRVPITKKML